MSADTAVPAEPPTRGQRALFTYDAFFSYNHRDGAVAAGIQKGLDRIGRRMGQLNALRVFRGCKSCSVASLNNLGLEKKLNDPFSAGNEAMRLSRRQFRDGRDVLDTDEHAVTGGVVG